MTQPQRRNDQRRRQKSNQPVGLDIWRTPGTLPPIRPIEVADDPAALLKSLGEPPLYGRTDVNPYFQHAIERSAGIAAALALSVDLLADRSQ